MNGTRTIDERDTGVPLPRLYLRPDEAARAIGISRRTLSEWQSSRVIGFRRIGRTVLFSITDIQAAIDRYRIAPVGEPKPRHQSIETGTMTWPPMAPSREVPMRKHRIQRIGRDTTTP
jgi:excisionase family DNA binding protein